MPITHTNAKGQIFSLYQGTTKTGKPKYYFAMRGEGTLAQGIPAGYEIYENRNAQVFLRRIPPKIITDEECQIVDEGMRTYATVKDYKIDVQGNAFLIYTAEQDIEALANIFKDTHPDREQGDAGGNVKTPVEWPVCYSPVTRTRSSPRMRVKLQLVMCNDQGEEETVTDIITLNKHHQRIEHLGLTLTESKQLLSTLQRHLLQQ